MTSRSSLRTTRQSSRGPLRARLVPRYPEVIRVFTTGPTVPGEPTWPFGCRRGDREDDGQRGDASNLRLLLPPATGAGPAESLPPHVSLLSRLSPLRQSAFSSQDLLRRNSLVPSGDHDGRPSRFSFSSFDKGFFSSSSQLRIGLVQCL